MNEVEALKQKIEDLESQLEEQKKMHEIQLSKIKSENYEALEASQTLSDTLSGRTGDSTDEFSETDCWA